MLLDELNNREIVKFPNVVLSNTIYLTITGSLAQGLSTDTSDFDVYGIYIPQKNIIFPSSVGYIPRLTPLPPEPKVFVKHHVFDPDALGGKGRNYDFNIEEIIRFINLAKKGNPTVLEILFTPEDCVLHVTTPGRILLDHRHLFITKACYHHYRNYAMSQLHKMLGKNPTGKRVKLREEFGYDVKFGAHVCRLLNYCEQILSTGTIDFRKDIEFLKRIRRGEVTQEQVFDFAAQKNLLLEKLFSETNIPEYPNDDEIRLLVVKMLEHHYGGIQECLDIPEKEKLALQKIRKILDEL